MALIVGLPRRAGLAIRRATRNRAADHSPVEAACRVDRTLGAPARTDRAATKPGVDVARFLAHNFYALLPGKIRVERFLVVCAYDDGSGDDKPTEWRERLSVPLMHRTHV